MKVENSAQNVSLAQPNFLGFETFFSYFNEAPTEDEKKRFQKELFNTLSKVIDKQIKKMKESARRLKNNEC
jgi:hypothetical protein